FGLSLALLLAWLVVYPILIVAGDAAHADALRAFVSRPGEWAALWASLWISLASVALAALIGVPLAFLFEWFEFPGRKALGALIALPAVLPPFVGVIPFLTARGSFSAPYVFGGGFRLMTTQIYSTKVNGDLALAMVETLALALVAVAGLVLLRHTQGEDLLVALGKGTAPRRRPIGRPAVRALATAV